MKFKLWLLIPCLIISFPVFSFTLEEREIDPEELRQFEEEQKAYQTYIVHLNALRTQFAKEMEETLGLLCSGDRGRLHGTIEELGMDFCAKRRATVEEARALHLLVIERFAQMINDCKPIQPFLQTRPFTYKNISISIAFKGINGSYADGTIYRISNVPDAYPPNRNRIFYRAKDPFAFSSIKLFHESREEAVERNRAASIENPAVHQTTEKEQVIDHFLSSFRKRMGEKHRFECWSIGGKMANQIEEVGARFIVVRQTSQEEARALILNLAHDLLNTINQDEALKPYLLETPFPMHRLRLHLGFRNKRYGTYRDGSLESVELEGEKITYFQEVPWIDGKSPGVFPVGVPTYATESYEEAIKILEETPKPSFFKKLSSKLISFLTTK